MTTCCEIDLTLGVSQQIPLTLTAPAPIELTVQPTEIALTVDVTEIQLTLGVQNQINLELATFGLQGPPGPQGPPGTGSSTVGLVQVQWSTPGIEAANVIEIAGSVLDYSGAPLASSVVDIEVRVTDGSVDGEPSATAYLTAASSPVGTVLAGSGTASMVIRSDTGSLKVAVHEPTASVHRYLWIRAAGHERVWVRAADGVQELVFA